MRQPEFRRFVSLPKGLKRIRFLLVLAMFAGETKVSE